MKQKKITDADDSNRYQVPIDFSKNFQKTSYDSSKDLQVKITNSSGANPKAMIEVFNKDKKIL